MSKLHQRILVGACLLLPAIVIIISRPDNPARVTAQIALPANPAVATPPRGIAGDFWADVVIGKPDFNTIAPNEVTGYRLSAPHGALVSTNTNGNGAKLFVYDATNNRILVADVAKCMASLNPGCYADFAIGQPNMGTAGCNHDSGYQQFPWRANAGADTLCTQPEDVLSSSEVASGDSMALDSQGRLFVVDYFNHRVLRYPNPFSGTPTPTVDVLTPSPTAPTATPTAIRAELVIGQDDVYGNKCNKELPNPLAEVDSQGNIISAAPAIPNPDRNTLCFNWGSDPNTGALGNNDVAGVDLDNEGNLWVADSGNNRVLRFPKTGDTISPDADIVLGQTSFQTRDPGLGLDHLVNPSVVRVDKRNGQDYVYVIDQGYNTAAGTPTPAPANNEYHRVLVFGPTFNQTPTANFGRLVGYYHRPLGLDFDIDRPNNLWVNLSNDGRLQAWQLPTPPLPPTTTPLATPVLAQILGGLSDPEGSIGIDNTPLPTPPPPIPTVFDPFELLFATSRYANDVLAFGLPRSPTPLPGPGAMPAPLKAVFGYGGSLWGNEKSENALAEGYGVAVSDNPTRPQLFVADSDRVLYWDNPATILGTLNLGNGQTGTTIHATEGETILHLKATQNHLYVSSGAYGQLDIYNLPLDANSTPATSLHYNSFQTIDGDYLEHYNTRLAPISVAPTSDDQYLWIGIADDSRFFRVRNNPSDPNYGKVDIILGQQDAFNDGCNCHKVTDWTDPTGVTITDNTVQRNATPTTTPEVWDAGARSVATIAAPEDNAWNPLKGYAQMTVQETGTDRAFGLKSVNSTLNPICTPCPEHDYRNIDYAFVLTHADPPGNDHILQAYVRGQGIVWTGTYNSNDRLRVALEVMDGLYARVPGHYRINFYQGTNAVYTLNNVTPNFPLFFEASIASPGGTVANAYLAASQHQNMTDSTLCLPSVATFDRQGNLWVSDDSLEGQGNVRLLEYDADLVSPPTPPTSVIYTLPASRIFPNVGVWEPAFDHQNDLFIGYNPYTGSDNPLPPTPLPGTLTPVGYSADRFKGHFPGMYVNPLYPLGSYTPTPVPSGSPTSMATPTRPAPSPNALLADLYSDASAATFDEQDNLYVRDTNRTRVMIYRQPGHGTQVVWATPVVDVAITPTDNSVQKTSGPDEVWDAGAVSVQAIAADGGHGYVMISVEGRPTNTPTVTDTPGTPTPTNTPGPCCTIAGAGGLGARRAFGLSSSGRFHGHRLQDMDFAFVLTGTNQLDVYKLGLLAAHVGTYDYNDVLKIAVEDGPNNQKVVRFYQNGAVVYTVDSPVLDYPLQLDASIATLGGRIANAFIGGDNLVTCSASGWCTGTPQNAPVTPTPTSALNGVAVLAPNNIWAVGGYANGTSNNSLVEQWDGTEWRRVDVSGIDVGMLHGVSAALNGTTWNMWAVGDGGVLFYDGTWHATNAPNGGNGVYARAANDVWTVGSNTQGIQHWAGGASWTTYTLSHSYTLNGVTASAPNNAWAVGVINLGNPPCCQPLIMHWDGTSWSTVTAPAPSSFATLSGVDGYDANHVWAVGNYSDTQGHRNNLTDYWDGTQWTTVAAPSVAGQDNELQSVRFTREGTAWAVGDYLDPNASQSQKTAILLWNGTSWALEDNPNPGVSSMLVGLATTVGSYPVITGAWAVGSYRPAPDASPQTLVESLKAPPPPAATTSYYMTTVSATKNYHLGCLAGGVPESGLIVLDYGQPRLWNPGPFQQYGTLLIGSQDKAYITNPNGGDDITTAAENFILGYSQCSPPAQAGSTTHATIAIGTNNNNLDGQAALTSAHAQAWASMVSNVQAYVISNHLKSYVDVQAGIDLQPDWSSYTLAQTWAQAYSSQQVSTLYNYGSTDGYPSVPPGEPTPVVPPPWAYSQWNSRQLYYVAGGIDLLGGIPGMAAMPQIFQNTLAKDWHAVAGWAIAGGRPAIQFAGAGSASTLCASITAGVGSGACFGSGQAWQVFFHELSADIRPGIPQPLDRATDIKCSNGSTSQSCK